MTIQEWQQFSIAIHNRADRVSKMIMGRARKACRDAGLDPTLLGIHPHNAMVSLSYGKPWPGVNYSLVRRCLWLQKKAWEPSRLASSISSRAWQQINPIA